MGNMANNWKKAKDIGETAFKTAQKAGKKSGFPKFKSDFQKTLDKLEASHDVIQKLAVKLKQEYANRLALAQQCQKIAAEYEKAITDTSKLFDGPTTRSAVLGAMSTQLERLSKVFEGLINEKSPV